MWVSTACPTPPTAAAAAAAATAAGSATVPPAASGSAASSDAVPTVVERNPAIAAVARDHASVFFPPLVPAAPKLSKLAQLWADVAGDPWVLATWQQLLIEVQLTRDLLAIRHAYQSFLKVFPSSAAHWRQLIELELNHKQYEEIERILPGALRAMPEIELWKMYLVYQKVLHAPPSGTVATEEQTRAMNVAIENAYEYVLEHMGFDLHSGQVWKSFINFVRAIPARSSAEEVGKTAQLRRLYQRVICIPIQPKELAYFWDEYQAFERTVAQQFQNKAVMTKMIADYQNRFAMTHKESQERRRKYNGILSASVGNAYNQAVTQSAVHVANRPSTSPLQQAKDALQLQHWIRYLRCESRKVENQDMSVYKSRVVLAYRQALIYCRHYPNVWADYLHFLGTPKMYFPAEQIRAAWKEFKEAMPYSIMPALIHADVEEELKHTADAKAHYESLLQPKKADEPLAEEASFRLPESVIAEQKKLQAFEQEAAAAKEEGASAPAAAAATAAAPTASSAAKEESKEEVKAEVDSGLVDIYKGDLHKTHPLVFILLMRFIRRTEGVDASRKVFLLARRSPSVTFHTYLFAAYAEHHINNDLQKAQAIYGVGMKAYGDRIEAYLLQYLHFLRETNDHNNLRLVFGRILLTESAESSEQSQNMTRKESAQMRKAQQLSAAAAKDSAAAAAALAAAKESGVTNEAANDPAIAPDDWWATINGLLDTASVVAPAGAAPASSSDSRAQERASSGLAALPSSTVLSLWSSYVSFERDTANELSVLVRAEEKRDSKLAVRYSHKILHWIDRWRFMDMWACSPQLRQTLEKVILPTSVRLGEIIATEEAAEAERLHGSLGLPAASAPGAAGVPRQRGILITDPQVVANLKASRVRPDLTRLTSFTASTQQFDRAAVRTRYGLGVPVPEQILNVMSVLPPSHLYQGPFVHPLLIVDMLQTMITTDAPQPPAQEAASSRKAPAPSGKRKQRDGPDEDDEGAGDANTPATDLYRKRQQQKLAAKQADEPL